MSPNLWSLIWSNRIPLVILILFALGAGSLVLARHEMRVAKEATQKADQAYAQMQADQSKYAAIIKAMNDQKVRANEQRAYASTAHAKVTASHDSTPMSSDLRAAYVGVRARLLAGK